VVWEAVFFLLVLKIPVIYLGIVVWWALRGQSDPGEPTAVALVADTPPDDPALRRRPRRSRRPAGGRPHGHPVTGYRARRYVGARG
jgi:hypothetical protein